MSAPPPQRLSLLLLFLLLIIMPVHGLRAQDIPFLASDSLEWRVAPGAIVSRILAPGSRVLVAPESRPQDGLVRVTSESGDSGWVAAARLELELEAPIFRADVERARAMADSVAPPQRIGFDSSYVNKPPGNSVMVIYSPAYETRTVSLRKVGRCPTNVPSMKNFRDGQNWMLQQDMRCELRGGSAVVVVPRGFVTDFASIPQPLRWLLGSTGPYGMAAILHDFLYWDQTCTREDADRLFKVAMQDDAVSAPFREALHLAVVFFGGSSYDGNRTDRAAGMVRVVAPPDDDVPPGATWRRYRQKLRSDGKTERRYVRPARTACAVR